MGTSEQVAVSGGFGAGTFICLALAVFALIAIWKVFTKAGQPGWGALIPIFNTYLLLKIAGKPGWWLILLIIPVVNLVIAILTLIGVANAFGKGGGFAVGLIFLPFIFFAILGFGNSTYQPIPSPKA